MTSITRVAVIVATIMDGPLSSIEHGSFDKAEYFQNGRLPTIGARIMDGVRAAVADEIDATEKAIIKLGFRIPE